MQFRTIKLLTIACALSVLAALCVSGIVSAQTTTKQKPAAEPPPQERSLTPAERRGRAIYFRGETSSKKEVMAMIGDVLNGSSCFHRFQDRDDVVFAEFALPHRASWGHSHPETSNFQWPRLGRLTRGRGIENAS